jgi:hypothetical protein
VTMKNVFWDIKTHFIPHRRHIAVMTMKNAVFWDDMPCGSSKNQCFRGTYRLHHQGDKNRRATNNVSSN